MRVAYAALEAVLAMIWAATCSLMSRLPVSITNRDRSKGPTEWAGIHEVPEPVVFVKVAARTRYDGSEDTTKDINKNLEKKGRNGDDLGPKLLKVAHER
jgi:hypothetical protein